MHQTNKNNMIEVNRNYVDQRVVDVLEAGYMIALHNGKAKLSDAYGSCFHYDIHCIRKQDLDIICRSYDKLGYLVFKNEGDHFIIKTTAKELSDFSQTPEMKEMFKNWKENEHPPEMVRIFCKRRSSKMNRVFEHSELLRQDREKLQNSFEKIFGSFLKIW